MNTGDLWALINKVNLLEDEGIDSTSTFEEANSVLEDEMNYEPDSLYHSQEEFDAEWELCRKVCDFHDTLIK